MDVWSWSSDEVEASHVYLGTEERELKARTGATAGMARICTCFLQNHSLSGIRMLLVFIFPS